MAELPVRLFTASEIARAVGGSLSGESGAVVDSVAVDSRRCGPSSLFVALPGERVDGHDFVGAALEAGSSCILARADRRAMVEAALAASGRKAAAVFAPDVLRALQDLALAYRLRFPRLLRIGITGSSGKTTTKECVASILSRSRSVVMNQGNLNSDIGLPLSIFTIREAHEAGVFEMGMNRKGEMGELARIFDPRLALVTNVGTAHIGILGSRDAIAEEKKSVFSLFGPEHAGFVWEDDEYNAFLKRGVQGEVLDFGPRSTKGLRVLRNLGLRGWELEWQGLSFAYPLPGKHNLLDAIGAAALAERAGAAPDDVAAGLASMRPLFGRSELLEGRFAVLRDCYNANPDSVQAAIGLCDSLELPGRRAYVLGSMLELGKESEAAHRAMGETAGNSKADALFFFGDEAKVAFDAARLSGFPGLVMFHTDIAALRAALLAYLAPGDFVLLKASRGMELERLTDAFGVSTDALGVGGDALGIVGRE